MTASVDLHSAEDHAIRQTKSSSGAARPIVLYPGVAPRMTVPSAISRINIESAFWRPALSAYMPIRMPPNGRTTKPTANVST